jgi:hypothetical protein
VALAAAKSGTFPKNFALWDVKDVKDGKGVTAWDIAADAPG